MTTICSQLELLPLESCEEYFKTHFENNIDSFAESDKLTLLRACLDLLSRLEGSINYQFYGRVLIFLARILSFFDKSGLNITSDCNIKHLPKDIVSILNVLAEKSEPKDEFEGEIEEGEALDSENPKAPEDAEKLFERFWKIHTYLNQPNLLQDKNSWYSFRNQIDSLITYMDNTPTKTSVWSVTSSFAVNPRTLSLQLVDKNFRRCILLQVLFILRSDKIDKAAQSSWTTLTTNRIYSLLGQVPHLQEGRRFVEFLYQLMEREEMWERWKSDKCPEIKKIDDEEIVSMRSTYSKKRKISEEFERAKQYNMNMIGSSQLTRLWNQTDSEKFNVPTLEQYLEPVLKESTEKRLEKFKDASYSFRALRLLSKKSSQFIKPSATSVKPLNEYLNSSLDSLYASTDLSPDKNIH